MSKISEIWLENRVNLYKRAKVQMENFGDRTWREAIVKDRGCDVPSRSKEENEAAAKCLCENQIRNIKNYMKVHYDINVEDHL